MNEFAFGDFGVVGEFENRVGKYNFLTILFPLITVLEIEVNKRQVVAEWNDQQLVLNLIPTLQIGVDSFGRSIEQHIVSIRRITLILQRQPIYLILRLVPNKQLNTQYHLIIRHLLIYRLRLKPNLHMRVLE